MGLFRVDILDGEMEISYQTACEYRGRGYGKAMLREGENWLKEQKIPGQVMVARVKKDNAASVKIFRELGYREETEGDHLIFRKERQSSDGGCK